MPIEFRCPNCNQQLRVPDDSAGKNAKCPNCQSIVPVPGISGAAPLPSQSPFGEIGVPPPKPSPPVNPFAPSAEVNPYASPQPAIDPVAPFVSTGAIVPQAVGLEPIMNYAFQIWQANLGLLVGVTLTGFAISLAITMPLDFVQNSLLREGAREAAVAVGIGGNLFANAVQMFLGIGQAQIALKLARRQRAEFGDLFGGGSRFFPVLLGLILAFVAVGVGLVLCIVPGIVLAFIYWPFYYLVVDNKSPLLDSFALASRITAQNHLTTFLIWLLSVGIMILGVVALCVGVLFAAPLVTLLWATAYLMMSGQIPSQPQYGKS